MKYTDIDLAGLTKILRAHATQILPPGMRELKNVYISRSDNSVTLRPDFMQDILNMPSLSAELEGPNSPEFLTGIYRVLDIDGYIYFSNMRPFSFENEEDVNLSEIYKTGTITVSGNTPIITGADTDWLENIWAGCLIREKDDSRWYPITKVASDTYITTSPPMHTLAGAEYEILRTHPMANGAWPIQFEKLGDLLVYNPANPTLPVDRGRISGPFYSNIGKADTFGVWKEFEPDIVVPLGEVSVIGGNKEILMVQPGGTVYWAWPLLVGGENGLFASGEQWISDYNKEGAAWDAIKAEWNYEDVHGRRVFPKGNGYPVLDDYQLIVTGRGVDIVQMEYDPWGASATVLYADGWLVFYEDPDDDPMVDRSYDELENKGPWLPPVRFVEWATPQVQSFKVFDPPVHGWVQRLTWNYYFYGSEGRIVASVDVDEYPYDDLPEDYFIPQYSTADIWDACHCWGAGEQVRDGSDWDTVDRVVFVGGVDDQGPTVIICNGWNDDSWRSSIHYHGSLGDQPLYGVTHMFAQDHGDYGLGTLVAVGGAGTILYSDDGGETWDPAEHSLGDFDLYDVASDSDGWCVLAGGEDGFCVASLDGEFWQEVEVTSAKIGQIEFDCLRGEFLLAVAGATDPIRLKRRIRYGTGDQVPLQRVGIISDNLSDKVLSIVWDGSQFIAGGSKIWTSPTGETWTQTWDGSTGINIYSLAFDGSGGVVAVGSGGYILHSADSGATWAIVEAFSTGKGTIRSVIWDVLGYDEPIGTSVSRFVCCRDKVILMSDDGITWVEDTAFDLDDEPMFVVRNPPNYQLATGWTPPADYVIYAECTGFDYGGTPSLAFCKSGQVYCHVQPIHTEPYLWGKYEDYYTRSENLKPMTEDPAGYERVIPAAAIWNEQFEWMLMDADPLRQKLIVAGRTPQIHLAGTYINLPGSRPIEPQEPNVLRTKFKSDGSVPELSGSDLRSPSGWITHNNLLQHDPNPAKSWQANTLFWIHGNKLLVSTDNATTWSKGYDLIIPTRNGVYDAPVADQSVAGYPVSGFTTWEKVGDNQLSPSTYGAMVSDGDDVFMASPFSPEGIVFLNITWDGKKLILGDPDEVPTGPEFIPPVVNVYNNAGEKLVFSFFSGVSS